MCDKYDQKIKANWGMTCLFVKSELFWINWKDTAFFFFLISSAEGSDIS